jgi:hypothetical protein
MPLHVRKEITHYNEMNDKIFDIDMNGWNTGRSVIKPISFHLFPLTGELNGIYLTEPYFID